MFHMQTSKIFDFLQFYNPQPTLHQAANLPLEQTLNLPLYNPKYQYQFEASDQNPLSLLRPLPAAARQPRVSAKFSVPRRRPCSWDPDKEPLRWGPK